MGLAPEGIVNVSLYQAAAALGANARWQEAISGNLAASSIPGYKKQQISFDAVQAGIMDQSGLPRNLLSLPRAVVGTSFAPGEMKATGVPTDAAIEGRGFFEVQLPNGSSGYTRDGQFDTNAEGQLVTKQGYPVVGDSGPIQLDKNYGGNISISGNGEVSQGSIHKGKLKVVDFNDLNLLTPTSSGYFIAQDRSLIPTEVREPSIRQNVLESANTSGVAEMANLIGVMRAYEANQRIVQVQDERMGRTITELGNPN